MGQFRSVGIPLQQYEEIKELIFEKAWLGYRSVPEFVRRACQKQIENDKLQISSQEKYRRDAY